MLDYGSPVAFKCLEKHRTIKFSGSSLFMAVNSVHLQKEAVGTTSTKSFESPVPMRRQQIEGNDGSPSIIQQYSEYPHYIKFNIHCIQHSILRLFKRGTL